MCKHRPLCSLPQYPVRWHCWLHPAGQRLLPRRAGPHAEWTFWKVRSNCKGEYWWCAFILKIYKMLAYFFLACYERFTLYKKHSLGMLFVNLLDLPLSPDKCQTQVTEMPQHIISTFSSIFKTSAYVSFSTHIINTF